MQPTTAIKLRDARHGDLPAIAHVMTLAFWDDNLFGDLIHPHREQYPRDSDLYWLRRLRVNFWDYRSRFLVAVEEADDDGKEEETIVGFSQWSRLGDGGKAMECHWLDPRNLLKPLSTFAMSLHALLYPNRAADPATEDVVERAYPHFKGLWSSSPSSGSETLPDRSESWYLDFMAVRPDRQSRGVGRSLARWGLERAARDRVCASVVSAWKKDEFCFANNRWFVDTPDRRVGFNVQYGSAAAGEGNPLKGVDGCNIYWWFPPSGTGAGAGTRYGTMDGVEN
ncbi:acyl-CoA N-acyltransferase [Xylariomycetidae sp. FL2044]|nr:acyl-CoA N-acyltransferase [Xylariomycetidae sp. FL2044]